MDKRFFNIFNLSEEQAIALLDTPQDQVDENDSRYIAASHLVNFPTEQSIDALIRAIQQTAPSLENRIVRRKSIETLGRLQATQALSIIRTCLNDEDCYTVENAVWAIGEIGTQDHDILEEVTQLLDRPGQLYRVIIHALTKLDYSPAAERIHRFINADDPPIKSAAISAICRFSKDYTLMEKVVALLQHPNVFARRLCIQDLIDARYYDAIPQISRCPVSLIFRLRGIRMLGEVGIRQGAIAFTQEVQPYLEQSLRDHPRDLDLVHVYPELPTLSFLVRELYETDFGRCYLATKTILENYPDTAPAELFATYSQEAHSDYGAHFHVIKLFGWLKHSPAYDLLIEALHNRQPQFQKSRAAAAIALGELGDSRAIIPLKANMETNIWDFKYAILMALEKLGDRSFEQISENDDSDWAIQAKLRTLREQFAIRN